MPSYHFSAQVIGRAKRRSAIQAAAYRAAACLRDEASGEVHDFSRRRGVAHAEILTPDGVPDWMRDRQELWAAVERGERRKDAQLAREINMALPHELSAGERLELVRGFVLEQFVARGMVADLALHEPVPGKGDDPRNFHAHVMLTLRQATRDGFRKVKTREWNSQAVLDGWRAAWAAAQNRALERAGHLGRVDHRTLEAQRADALARGERQVAAALDRVPEIHVGPKAQAMARRQRTAASQDRVVPFPKQPRRIAPPDGRAGGRAARSIRYTEIDAGASRQAYNAARVELRAQAQQREVERLQVRAARLKRAEARYLRQARDAETGWRDWQAGQGKGGWFSRARGNAADRQQLFAAKRAQAANRVRLIRLLLGRVDRILAGLFLVHERSLQRYLVLDLRARGLLEPWRTREQGSGRQRGGL